MADRLWDSVALLNFCSANEIWGINLRVMEPGVEDGL
jgi:hypothetical protein